MKFRSALTCLAVAAVAFTGCDKIKKVLHLTPKAPEVVSTPTPAPSPTATPAATPTPKPTANHNAGVIVLCYHRVEDSLSNAMVMKPADFEQQMQAIKDSGFTVISMQDFLAWRRDEKEIPVKSALITIDDGYVSAYENAMPILKKFGYPFTMFVYIQYIGSGGKSITWDQLAEMRDAGVEIGCHSYTHQNLKGKAAKSAAEVKRLGYEGWLRKEIVESKQLLESRLGIKVSTFAYPEGSYNEKAREVVKEGGYEAAFVTYGQRNGFSSPSFDVIGRYAIEAGKPKTFQTAMAMIGGGVGPGAAMIADVPSVPQVSSLLESEPAAGATVSDPKPLIKAVLAKMGAIDAGSVEMRISGFGVVPVKYDEATKTATFQPTTQPLRDKEYTVIISAKVGGKKSEARWSFKFDPAATPKS